MNNERRKEIRRGIDLLTEAQDIFETVQGEEQDAFDNMPEGLQESERGERMEEVAGLLDGIKDAIETAVGEAEESAE